MKVPPISIPRQRLSRAFHGPGGDIAVGAIGSLSTSRRITMAAPARCLQPSFPSLQPTITCGSVLWDNRASPYLDFNLRRFGLPQNFGGLLNVVPAHIV
jgi:hypothetical protein